MAVFEPSLTLQNIQSIMIDWDQASRRWAEIARQGRSVSDAEFTGIIDVLSRAHDALRPEPKQPAHAMLRRSLAKARETRQQISGAQRRLARAVALTTLRGYSGREQPLPAPGDGLLDTIERLVGFEPGDGGVDLRELRRALASLPSLDGRAVSLWGDEELAALVARAEAAVFARLGRPKDNYVHQPRFYSHLDHAIFFTKRIVEGTAETVSWNGWH